MLYGNETITVKQEVVGHMSLLTEKKKITKRQEKLSWNTYMRQFPRNWEQTWKAFFFIS